MSSEIVLQQNASAADLAHKREELAAARAQLAERTAELDRLRASLKLFEDRYFREVGILYAELDELEATIAERELALYDSDAARKRATDARQQAEESRAAASEHVVEAPRPEPPPNLKVLFREVARRIHPDRARDEAEAAYLTLLMARANQAYSHGDADTLQRLLNDCLDLQQNSAADDATAELTRAIRQVEHARRDLLLLELERGALLTGDIALLHADTQAAAAEHRDLVGELAAGLCQQIADAHYRLAFVERQMFAHGR